MRRFSSRSTRSTFSMCRSQVLPTSVATGAQQSTMILRLGSLAAVTPLPRVMPNTAMSERPRSSGCTLRKNSLSLGLEPGKPPSMRCTPRSAMRRGDAHLLVHRHAQPLALHAVAQGGVVEEHAARWAHRAPTGVPVLRAYSWNRAMMSLVSGPGTPAPILRLSTSTTGPTSAAVPVRKASSAL